MGTVILAEHRGQAWLVGGVEYIDDLLMNTLPEDVSIEIVVCERESEINELWVLHSGDPEPGTMPWAIHPGIVKRIRRQSSGHNVFFGQWSAALDKDAEAVIRAAAAWAQQFGEAQVHLVSYIAAGAKRAETDLANLRCGQIEAELEKYGIEEARCVRESRDAAQLTTVGAESQRIDIEVRAG
jgi:hypothetical protein